MEKVIVVITTFNLEKYIAQALDSILMQKTGFPFKILVGDDCSTDNTLSILSDYAKRYPEIIEVKTADRNLGSLANSNRLFDGIDCQYFSFLDGDDYWLDENRLQKQVDFLDAHPEYAMCGGNTQYMRDGVLSEMLLSRQELNRSYSFDDYVHERIPFIHTSSLLVRNTVFCKGLPQPYIDALGTFEECALRGEDFRRILHLQQGPVYLMEDLFSVYRIHAKGLWQSSAPFKKLLEGAISTNFYGKYFGEGFNGFFKKQATKSYRYLLFTLLLERHSGQSLSEKDYLQLSRYIADYSRNSSGAPQNDLSLKLLGKCFNYFNK